MNAVERKKLAKLHARQSFLERKIQDWKGEQGPAYHHMAAEHSALGWAIGIITDALRDDQPNTRHRESVA